MPSSAKAAVLFDTGTPIPATGQPRSTRQRSARHKFQRISGLGTKAGWKAACPYFSASGGTSSLAEWEAAGHVGSSD